MICKQCIADREEVRTGFVDWRHGERGAVTLEKQHQKTRTRARSHALLRAGLIVRQPCAVCGGAAEMHHSDYRDPYRVTWLCVEHHQELHHKGRSVLSMRRRA